MNKAIADALEDFWGAFEDIDDPDDEEAVETLISFTIESYIDDFESDLFGTLFYAWKHRND